MAASRPFCFHFFMSCAFTQTCLDGFFFSKTELHHIYVLVILMRYPIQDGCQFAILLASLSAMRSLSDRLIFRRRPSTFIVNFFKTAGQTHLILGIPVPRDDLIQICSNCDEICNFVFLRLFLPFLVKKSSSSKPLVRHLWNLVYRSPGMT